MIDTLSNLFIPLIVLFVVFYGIIKKIDIYNSFIKGSKDGIKLGISIIPYILAMIFSVNILIESRFINDFFSLFKPLFNLVKIPIDILPMALIRPISGNASFVVMQNIIAKYGVDSYLGKLASIIQGSTDTTIYVISLYFGSVGIKNIKYSLKAGLLVDFITVLMSIIIVSFIFS